MAAWQHRSHPALLLAHPGVWDPGFWAGQCDWEGENTWSSLYRWWWRCWWDPEDNHNSPGGAKAWEEVLGTTSGDGSDPALSAETVLVGSAPLWSTGGSCQSEEKLALAPENQFMV